MRAVFLDYDTVDQDDLDAGPLRAVLPDLELRGATGDEQIDAAIADVDVVLLNKLVLDAARLRRAGRLRLIALAATGTDNVDLAAAAELGIAVCNVRGYCTASVVQHVWAMILYLTQRLPEYRALAVDGSWAGSAQFTMLSLPIRELAGRTLGIVGWGELGRGVGSVARAFGMHVIVANRPGGPSQADRCDLDDLLARADVVSLHCPLTEATRGMIDARRLGLMKRDALLINTARGGLLDGHALAAALKAGALGGAGIDVLAREPPAGGDPLLDPAIPNLLVTPHVAWAAREARQRCIDMMADNVRDFLAGGRLGRVV
ncbi:MAG: glycerate dehydrogenase [Gammaproteobacteria bacterium]|nr:glycerate dehydrogenase [Gammaproteobacteria bacterium]